MLQFMRSPHLAALGIASLLLGTPYARAATAENGFVSTILGVDAGLCLGVSGSSSAAGAQLQSQSCTGSIYQQWKFIQGSANTFEIVNVGSGKCIDVPGGSSTFGTTMQQWNCGGGDYQKWEVSPQGSGQLSIISKYNHLAMEVTNASKMAGARVGQWAWAGGKNQKWSIPEWPVSVSGMPANGAVITLTGIHTGHCLGVTDSSTASGARLRMQACSASPFQQWKVTLDAAGDYRFANVGSGFCADVPGASAERTVLQQWGCGNGTWQKWQFHGDATGHYYITSKSSGLALEEDVLRKPGAVLQSAYIGGANQHWAWGRAGAAKTETESKDEPIGFGAGTTGGAGPDHEEVTVTDPAKLATALCSSFGNDGICSDTTRRIIRISGVLDFRHREGNASKDGCLNTAVFANGNGQNCKSPGGQQEQTLNDHGACTTSKAPIYKVTYDAASDQPLRVGSNKTVIGVGAHSGIKGKGLKVQGVANVIIRNLSITDLNDGVVWGGDGISLSKTHNVWIANNLIARIGRQHIGTTGDDPVQNVTISANYFDGDTDYGYFCNGRHYYVLLMNGADQTITIVGNRIHSSSGRSPEVGERGGIIHVVNNYYDNNYWTGGVNGTNKIAVLAEGNYFAKGEIFHPVFDNTNNKTDTNSLSIFAPVASNTAAANNACVSVFGRNCTANVDMGNSVDGQDFHLNPKVMSTIQSFNSAAQVIKSVVPVDPSTLPNRAYGPRADIVP